MTVENLSFAPFSRAYHQHQDKLILLIVVLLSLYLIAFLAEITWRLFGSSQDPEVQTFDLVTNQSVATKQSSTVDLSSLKRAQLFGNVVQTAAPVQQQEITEAPETKLNLTLTGVVSSSDEAQGAAIIEKNNAQATYGIGDKIEGTNATLDKIYVDRVIIKNRLVRETLMLDGIDFDEANKQNQRQQNVQQNRTNIAGRDNLQTQTSAGPVRLEAGSQAQKVRASIASSPTSFTDFISVQPHSPQGALIGYRVSPGKQPEFFSLVGLRSGDIITQINGLDLSDIQQSLEAIEVLKESQSLQMDIIRSGEPISLDIEMPSSEES